MRTIYLDYNATTPIAPEVQEAILPYLAEYFGDPSSLHALGRASAEVMEEGRFLVSLLLGCRREEVVFTSGGTESCNLAIIGTALARGLNTGGHLIVSNLEHAAVLEPARFLETLGFELTIVEANRQGVVSAEAIGQALRKDTFLVSVTAASHEIGTLQPIETIGALCRSEGILFHSDACQTVGRIHMQVEECQVDLLSLSGHKFYAPKGIGALFVRQGTPIQPIIHGKGNEGGLRSGMENVGNIVAIGQAASQSKKYMDVGIERMQTLRNRLEKKLTEEVGSEMRVLGKGTLRLPNTLAVCLPEVNAAKMQRRLPEMCFSTMATSFSGSNYLSPTIRTLGLNAQRAQGVIRLSVGRFTTEEQVDRAVDKLVAAWEDTKYEG